MFHVMIVHQENLSLVSTLKGKFMKKFGPKVLFGLLLVLLASVAVQAQDRGGITGTVTDPSGASLSGAVIKVTNLARAETISLASTASCQYTAVNLIPGIYEVRVEVPGFRPSVLTGVEVKVDEVARVDVQLKVGNVAEVVTVAADTELLKTESSDVGTSVESGMISNLPLQVAGAVRDPLAFAKLTPGFNGQTANSAREFQTYYTVNGGQSGGTQILVDGADIELTSVQSQFNTGVSVDAVEEFKVMSSNFSAEYGRSTGGIINLSLKSGTNQFHGSAYDFLRNDAMDERLFQSGKASHSSKRLRRDFLRPGMDLRGDGRVVLGNSPIGVAESSTK
jgi:Carboxypeptidase regulatory-like domain/TonB-dependent Receptor Plug Domain